MNYFAIERGNAYKDHFSIRDNETDSVVFENYLDMTYDEMKSQEDLEDFVLANMEAADAMAPNEDDQTIVTLIGEDDVFIWSIIMGTVEEGSVNYVLVDWKKDGKNYRYTPLTN